MMTEGKGMAPAVSADDRLEDRDTQKRSTLTIAGLRVGVLIMALLLWQFVAGAFDIEFFVSKPTEIWAQLQDWITSGYLLDNVGITLQATLYGFLLGAATGIVMGFVLGLIPLLGRLLDPFITAIYSLPKLALAPLFVLWFGIDLEMKVVLTAVIVFFLVFWNTYTGVRETDEELMDVLRVMGAKRRDMIRKVVLPGSLTYIYVGLKLAIPYALVGAVVGELIASNRGIGYILMSAAGAFNTAGIMAALVVLMLIATIMNALLNLTEVYVMRWKRAGR
ncbi:ABC transporter permease [Actinophytocola sp.]|uniref:ABC transporter permease n=1 Tax=Actinophytocola sp. TaxID=1872138 RepID=UPI003D6BA2C8